MAYDGNGNYVRAHNWTADAANSVDINATEMDAEDNGFAAGLTNAVTRDGQGKMATDFLPNSDNTLNLGTGSKRWATINGIAIAQLPITQAAISLIFQPQTLTESAVSITPLNFFYPEGYFLRYILSWVSGQADTLSVNLNALNNATKVCAWGKSTLWLPAGTIFIAGTWNSAAASGLSTTTNGGLTIRGCGKVNSIIQYVAGANNSGVGWDMVGLAYGHFEDFAFVGGSSTSNCPNITVLQGAANVGGFIFSGNIRWIDCEIDGYGDYIFWNAGCEQQTWSDCTAIPYRDFRFAGAAPFVLVCSGSAAGQSSAFTTINTPVVSMTVLHWSGAKAALIFHGNLGILFHMTAPGAAADIRFDDWFQVQSPSASATSCVISGTGLTIGGSISGTILIGHLVTGPGVTANSLVVSGSGNNWVLSQSSSVSSSLGFVAPATFKFMTDDSGGAAGTALFNCGGERLTMEVASSKQDFQLCNFSVPLAKGIKFEGHAGGAGISAIPFQFTATSVPTNCWFDWDPNESGPWTGGSIVSCLGTENGVYVRAPVASSLLISVANSRTIDGFAGLGLNGNGTDYAQQLGAHQVIAPSANGQFNLVRTVKAGAFVSANSNKHEGGQTTQAVTTGATTILTIPNQANFVHVVGSDAGGDKFYDTVKCGQTTFVVTDSLTLAGTPTARTYSIAAAQLKLSMASGTYNIQVDCEGKGMQV